MSSLLCQFFHRLQRHPLAVLIVALLVTLFSLFILQQTSLSPSFSALFDKQSEEKEEASNLLFRSTAHLTLVVQGEDPAQNRAYIADFIEKIGANRNLAFAIHRFDSLFIAQNYLLYLPLADLEEMRNEISHFIDQQRKVNNPFIVEIESSDSPNNLHPLIRYGEEFLPEIRSELGSKDGKIQLIFFLPLEPIQTPLQAHRFLSAIDSIVTPLKPDEIDLFFTGDVVQLAQAYTALKTEVPWMALFSAGSIILLLLFSFFRQPLIPLIALLPVLAAISWILAFAHLTIGVIAPLTILLTALLFALGTGLIVYLLGRYEEERLKGLGPKLSLETVLLETGPAVVLGSLITSIGFFVLLPSPLKGYRDFGLVGGVGMLFLMCSVMILFPALLRLLQRHKTFQVAGKSKNNLLPFQRTRLHKKTLFWMAIPLIAILAVSFLFGLPLTYEKELREIGLISGDDEATRLMKQIDLYGEPPVMIRCPDSASATAIASRLSSWGRERKLLYSHNFHTGLILPADQKEKLLFFEELREMLDSNRLATLSPEELFWAERLLQRLPQTALSKENLPPDLLHLMSHLLDHHMVIAFPRFSMNEGMNAVRVSQFIDPLADRYGASASGTPIYLGRFVDQSLAKMPWTQVVSLLAMLLLLTFEIGRTRLFVEVLLPISCGIIPALTWIFQSHAGLNPLNVLLLPFIFGLTLFNVIQVQYRYHEEGFGSLPFVLKSTGVQVAIATAMIIIVFFPFQLSSLKMMRTVGFAVTSGAVGSLIATLIATPLFLGIKEHLPSKRR